MQTNTSVKLSCRAFDLLPQKAREFICEHPTIFSIFNDRNHCFESYTDPRDLNFNNDQKMELDYFDPFLMSPPESHWFKQKNIARYFDFFKSTHFDFLLTQNAKKEWILLQSQGSFSLNFKQQSAEFLRQSKKNLSQGPLYKAFSAKYFAPETSHRIFDASMGTAKDALLLNSFGARVSGIERHPLVYFFLLLAQEIHPTFEQILYGDSLGLSYHLYPLENRFDAIYFDPMFEVDHRASLPRKEMALFKNLVGADGDASAVLLHLLLQARDRVVVKRKLRGVDLGEVHSLKASMSYYGTTTRYDVYLL